MKIFIFGIIFAILLLIVIAYQTSAENTVCKQDEIMINGTCTTSTDTTSCVPTKSEEDPGADTYLLDDSGECVSFTCKNGYSMSNGKCSVFDASSLDVKENVKNRFSAESAKPGRVFIKLEDNFNLDTVVAQFFKDDTCSKSDKIEQCATDLLDYCDNNPTSSKFGIECDEVVGPVGANCVNDISCGALKCKKTPDSSKSFCY